MKKKIIVIMVILLFSCGCSNSKEETMTFKSITPDSVYTILDEENVYIIDVRESYEYEAGHIPNAYNVPLTRFQDIQTMFLPIDGKIIVYCLSGGRSKQAAQMLLEYGYTDVYDMGGITDWDHEIVNE